MKKNGSEEGRNLASEVAPFMGASVRSSLERARALHKNGEIEEARRLYRGVLAMDSNNAEALHLLGLAYDQTGNSVLGETLIARSLKFEKRYAWAFANHGLVLVRLQRYEDALVAVLKALRLDPRYAPALVSRGNALLGLERYPEAIAAYDEALAITPTLAEAWSNRGNVLLAMVRPADALICFNRALQVEPGDYATHMNRGHALRSLGRPEEALRSYRLALVIRPDMHELLSQCGSMLLTLSRDAEALIYFNQALEIKPDDLDTLYRSCVALDLSHQYAELLVRCDRILSLNPEHPAAWLGRGNALQGMRRHEEAVQAFARALDRDPGLVEALNNQGVALRMLERYSEALDSVNQGLDRAGMSAKVLCSRAQTLQQLGRFDEALESYTTAAAIEPANASEWAMRGAALQQLLRHEEALECFERVLVLDPNMHSAHRDEAFCRLLLGDFEKGWKKYEYRWLEADAARGRRHTDRPLWTGRETIVGKTILLHAEQGYGDTLQFCRYVSLVEARGAKVILEVPRALKTLLSTLRGSHQLVVAGEPLPRIDMQCPLLSVPLALGTSLDTIPAQIPYLHANNDQVHTWAQRVERIGAPGRLRVGLAWSGNAIHNNDINRSIPLAALEPLYAMDALFVSLLPQVRERDAATLAQCGIVQLGSELRDFSDTAALIENLDVVITVDTSVAHLTGALGKPVWVLLPRVPDWRWLRDRDDSPWYPSARLYRQEKPGDWPGVIGRVAHELTRLADRIARLA